MNHPSQRYLLLERELGGDGSLAEFVAAGLTAKKSWTAMAAELAEGTRIEISDETLRRWFSDRVRVVIEPEAASR